MPNFNHTGLIDMKIILATTLAVTASAASAGALDPVVIETVPVVPVAPMAPMVHSWTGGYAGLSFGAALADEVTVSNNEGDGELEESLEDGTALGVFGGYNFQNGNIVYGAELAYYSVSDVTAEDDDDGEELLDSIIDLRGRLGYAFGNAMVYGAVGFSKARTDDDDFDPDLTGFNYGIGVDYAVSPNFVIGLDYTGRDLEDDDYDFEGTNTTVELDVDTVSIRGSYHF